jgi:hypothetical protein
METDLPVSMMRLKCCPPIVTLVRYSSSKSLPSTATVDPPAPGAFLPGIFFVGFPRRAARAPFLELRRGVLAVKGTENSAGGSAAASFARGAGATWRTMLNSAWAAPSRDRAETTVRRPMVGEWGLRAGRITAAGIYAMATLRAMDRGTGDGDTYGDVIILFFL